MKALTWVQTVFKLAVVCLDSCAKWINTPHLVFVIGLVLIKQNYI